MPPKQQQKTLHRNKLNKIVFLEKIHLSIIFKLSSLVVIISFLLVSLTVVKMNQAEKFQLITIKNQSKLKSLGRKLGQGSTYLTSEIRRGICNLAKKDILKASGGN